MVNAEVQYESNVLSQLVRATRASTTFPKCSLRLRSATAREISISDICPATKTHHQGLILGLNKQTKAWANCETHNKFNVLLLDGNFGQLLLSAGQKTIKLHPSLFFTSGKGVNRLSPLLFGFLFSRSSVSDD